MSEEKNPHLETKEQIAQQLKETVAKMKHIENIYFDAEGNHYFNVHEHQGKKYARILRHIKMEPIEGSTNKKKTKIVTPVESTKIVKTISRDKLLNQKAEPEKEKEKDNSGTGTDGSKDANAGKGADKK